MGVPHSKELAGVKIIDKIGSGGFSEVYRGTKDGKDVAIKIISKKVFKKPEDRADMLREVEIMNRVKGHANVTNLVAQMEDKDRFVVVMELADGGDVMSRIEELLQADKHFTEALASSYFKQMLEGVKHCHDKLVVHRDLKPENFLLSSKGADAAVKVTDFGLSAMLTKADEVLTEGCGSAYYIAPEVFHKRYGMQVDAFALGVILFILLSGQVPFGGTAADENGIFKAIQTDPLVFGPTWESISPAAKELIAGMLEKDPAKRYTVEQALAHPWVSGGAAPDKPISRSIIDSLMHYNAANKFKREAVKLVASSLTAGDVKDLRAAFMKIDKDNSGFITKEELIGALTTLAAGSAGKAATAAAAGGATGGAGTTAAGAAAAGPSSDFSAIIAKIDADGDNRISWEEFLSATVEAQMVHHQQEIWEAFNRFDKDGSGTITAEELRLILHKESPEQIEKYIAEYDTDKDGTINYEEFLRMMLPKNLKFRVTKS